MNLESWVFLQHLAPKNLDITMKKIPLLISSKKYTALNQLDPTL
jgi:hypothetical protein